MINHSFKIQSEPFNSGGVMVIWFLFLFTKSGLKKVAHQTWGPGVNLWVNGSALLIAVNQGLEIGFFPLYKYFLTVTPNSFDSYTPF